ncbi:MAG: hypothetical protein ABI406_05145 [Ktedonobacteraceae bacterium]
MSFDRLRYELLLMGRRVLLTPVLVMVCFGLFAGLLGYLKVNPGRFLLAGLEMFLPLAAGVIIATIATQDPAIELQLTLPKQYRMTTLRRLLLIVCWSTCIAFVSSSILSLLKLWYAPQQVQSWTMVLQFFAGQLAWLSPLLWFAAISLCLAALTHNSTAVGTLLSGIWLLETIFAGNFVSTNWLRPAFLFPTTLTPSIDFWLANRVELLATALVLLLIGYLLLRNTEGLLKGSSEE